MVYSKEFSKRISPTILLLFLTSGVTLSEPVDESQEMGDSSKEPTEEERDQSDEKRSEAMKAFAGQQFDEAIKLYTEAILLNPQSALLFAKRGQVKK